MQFKHIFQEIRRRARQWWHKPLVLALRRQWHVDLLSCEFEASLLYRASSRTEKQVEGEEREENRR